MKKNEIVMNDYAQLCRNADHLELEMFDKYEVQRGLRDKNGNGVVTGLTNVSRIESFQMIDGVKTPCEGRLWYRGGHWNIKMIFIRRSMHIHLEKRKKMRSFRKWI